MTTVADLAIPPDNEVISQNTTEVFSPDAEVASASVELQAVLLAARQARTFTEESLRRWGESEELIEAALLIVCELATNAIRHGARETEPGSGPEAVFTLRLGLRPDVLHIEVHDGSATLPVQRAAGREDDCGRGLLIIAALAESWTCGPDPHGGKWVRAALSRVAGRSCAADALMG